MRHAHAHRARRRPCGRKELMAMPVTSSSISRREFLADAGLLVVAFTLVPRRASPLGAGHTPVTAAPSADQLDSWLVIGRDERITVYAGKVELGTGVRSEEHTSESQSQ